MAEIIKIDEKTWRIEDDGVRFFVLLGNEKALMIDSGMNTSNALEIVKSIKDIPKDMPIELLNTHADRDHIAGNDSFKSFYMSPNEAGNLERHGMINSIIPIKTGDIIDLGDRHLEIIDNPGHTPGSVAILDVSNRILYSGDAVQNSRIYMFGEHRNMKDYIESLENLKLYVPRFDLIFPSHGDIPVKPELIDKLIEGAGAVMNNTAESREVELFGNKVRLYQFDYAGFLYLP